MSINEWMNATKFFITKINDELNKYRLSINLVSEKHFDSGIETQKITIRNIGKREVKIDSIGYADGGRLIFNPNNYCYEYFYDKRNNNLVEEDELTNNIGKGLIIKPNETKYINYKSKSSFGAVKSEYSDDNLYSDIYHKNQFITLRDVLVLRDTENNTYYSSKSIINAHVKILKRQYPAKIK